MFGVVKYQSKIFFWVSSFLFSRQAEIGGSGLVNRRVPGQQSGEQYVTKIPNNKVNEVPSMVNELIVYYRGTPWVD